MVVATTNNTKKTIQNKTQDLPNVTAWNKSAYNIGKTRSYVDKTVQLTEPQRKVVFLFDLLVGLNKIESQRLHFINYYSFLSSNQLFCQTAVTGLYNTAEASVVFTDNEPCFLTYTLHANVCYYANLPTVVTPCILFMQSCMWPEHPLCFSYKR